MKPDIYYGTVLKTCRDFDIILVNNFIDRVTVTGNFLFMSGEMEPTSTTRFCAVIPDELATREEGAVAVATAIEAGDERRARAKFHWQFLEHYPAAQDCAYKFIICEDKPGIPRPALDSWDAEYMQENRWDEESASFVPVCL
jgi:hypothetical protein